MAYTPHNAPPGFDWVVRLENWQHDANGLRLTLATAADAQAELTFVPYAPHIWKMRMVIPGAPPEPATPIVMLPPSGYPVDFSESDAALRVESGGLTLRIDKDPFCIHFIDTGGRDVLRENPSDIDGLGRPFVLPLGFVPGNKPLITESWHLRPDEHLFGLGEKFTPLDKTGQRIISWTQDAFGSTSERSHKNIPFLMSTRGYGLLLDSGARITWELGTVSCQSYTTVIEGTTLDAYIIDGATPAQILERYSGLTGRAPVPPRWSFGLWLSGSGVRRDRARIEAMIEQVEQLELPVDVIHVDTWWMKWRHYANFRFDPDAFPAVQTMIDGIHDRGLHLSVWEQPYISVENDLFQIGQQRDFFLRQPDGSVYIIDYGLSLAPRPDGTVRIATPETSWNARVAIVDLSNPDAVAWYKDLHRPLLRMGLDAFKTDFGEDVPLDAVFSNGETGAIMHNLYPLLYNEAVFSVMREEKGYGLVWSRSGTAGNQRYPVCWSGDPAADWDSLACTIRGGLSIGQSGVPFWSSDIGGYRGMPSPELYIRWAQFTLLCSHARMHGDSAREPWSFGADALAAVRRAIELRYALFPYLYSAALEASRSGLPVIRAMPLAFPDDRSTYEQDLQYMLGPSLLIAPIYDASGERAVYLPAGTWIDYWTGEALAGPRYVEVIAPLDRIPIYVRGGAVVPMMAPARRIPETLETVIVTVYPGGESRYTLLDDDGETRFTHRTSAEGSALEWQGTLARTWLFRLIDYHGPAPTLNGASCRATSAAQAGRPVLEVVVEFTTSGRLEFLNP